MDLYEKNEKIGKKLFITGKGRCNVTNETPIENFFDHVPTNPRFLYSALYSFSNEALKNEIESAGTALKTERGGRVFPVSDKSSDILKAFNRLLKDEGVNVLLNKKVTALTTSGDVCMGIICGGKEKKYDAVVLCCGGFTYPSTGSDGSGYELARPYHNIVAPEPALVGLTTRERWPGKISGLSLKNVAVTLFRENKKIFEDFGECLFTHNGISGPVILSASSFMRAPFKGYRLEIDLKPALDPGTLDKRILKDFSENLNKDFSNSLSKLLPKNLIPVVVEQSGIGASTKVNAITRAQRERLGYVLKHLPLTISGTAPKEGAIVTRGGVDVREIEPDTMASKNLKNLYFAGEMIDVDALTGGYNIQIACSTGFLAGVYATQNASSN